MLAIAIVLSPWVGLTVLGLLAWRDHQRNLDPVQVILRILQKEARQDMRQAIRQLRRSRKRRDFADLTWLKELESDRS